MPGQDTADPAVPASYPDAVRDMLGEFAGNSWFLGSYWPENEPRIRFMVDVTSRAIKDPAVRRCLEIGCATGYVAYLYRRFGFGVAACDAYHDEKRHDLFQGTGITYQQTNLNDVAPLSEYPSESFDLVLLGEVFEHILNQPAGLLRGIHRLLRPGGLVVLTTPNPSSLANAVRLLGDRYILWGTNEFLRETKLDGGTIIDKGGIHYHEYPAWVVRDLMVEVGFRIEGTRYVPAGVAPTHSFLKRALKRLILFTRLDRFRLLAPGYVIWATKSPAH